MRRTFRWPAVGGNASGGEGVATGLPLEAVAGSTTRMVAVALLTLIRVSLYFAQPSHAFSRCQHGDTSLDRSNAFFAKIK